ncbi:hypothetical protein, partial [Microbaculum marinisediminis]
SPESGERSSAALKAHEMVAALGMTWDDVLSGRADPAPVEPRKGQKSKPAWMSSGEKPKEAPEGWAGIVEYLHANLGRLAGWEVVCVRNIARWRGIPKQGVIDHLTAVYRRLVSEDATEPGREVAA